jgi:hypothetical protein
MIRKELEAVKYFRCVLSFLVLMGAAAGAGARNRGDEKSFDGYSQALASKAEEIVAACGSHVISTYRPGAHIAGTGRMSLHAVHKAFDIEGNAPCIYAHLEGWSGGYSVDYGRVRHVHVSLGGREDGIRFAHHSHSRHSHYASYHGGREHRHRHSHHWESIPGRLNGARQI